MKPFYKYFLITLIASFLFSCNFFNKKKEEPYYGEDIEIIELDQIPMYGSTVEYGSLQKTAEQMEADKMFLINSDKVQASRILACIDYVEFGWYYLKQGNTEMAMRRNNQAWQLDSTNPDVYGLFAAILNAQDNHVGALDMLDRGIHIKPEYIGLYDMYLSESIDLFRQTGDNSDVKNLLKLLDNIHTTEDSITAKIDKIKNEALEFLNRQ